MAGTFISYRREEAAGYAGRLRESLQRRLGPSRVFRDVDTLRPGQDFVRAIDEGVASCRVMLVVIGRQWADARDQSGQRRLEDPNDFVRLEVVKALTSAHVVVVPVLVESASIPLAAQLPESMQPLVRRHAISLRDETWDTDVDRIVATINDVEMQGVPAQELRGGSRRRVLTMAGVAIALLMLAATIFVWTQNRNQRADERADPSAANSLASQPQTQPTQVSPSQSTSPAATSPTPANEQQKPQQKTDQLPAALFTVNGAIVFEYGAAVPEHFKVALVWAADRRERDTAYQSNTLGTITSGQDGRAFSISIYAVPSESMCMKFGGELLAVGNIVAFDDANDDGLVQTTELVGGVGDHLITYASAALPQALRAFRKRGQPLETMLQIRPGLWLNRSVSPQEQGRTGGFDDLVPVPPQSVTLVIVPKGQRPHFPNWT